MTKAQNPKPPLKKIKLQASEAHRLFYAAAETLLPGDFAIYESALLGEAGRTECLSLRLWLRWERQRRLQSALDAGKTEDQLADTQTNLRKLDNQKWALELHKNSPGKIIVTRSDGRVETNDEA